MNDDEIMRRKRAAQTALAADETPEEAAVREQWKLKISDMKADLRDTAKVNWRELGNAYVTLLQVPAWDPWRVKHQAAYADLRDALAVFYDKTPQEIQDGAEDTASKCYVRLESKTPPKCYVRQPDGSIKPLEDFE